MVIKWLQRYFCVVCLIMINQFEMKWILLGCPCNFESLKNAALKPVMLLIGNYRTIFSITPFHKEYTCVVKWVFPQAVLSSPLCSKFPALFYGTSIVLSYLHREGLIKTYNMFASFLEFEILFSVATLLVLGCENSMVDICQCTYLNTLQTQQELRMNFIDIV